jgi:hypothetical protein
MKRWFIAVLLTITVAVVLSTSVVGVKLSDDHKHNDRVVCSQVNRISREIPDFLGALFSDPRVTPAQRAQVLELAREKFPLLDCAKTPIERSN